MKGVAAIVAVLAAALAATGSGLFLGAELAPWVALDGTWTVVPIYLFGWEGAPVSNWGVSFLATFGIQNPAILDGWYMGNLSVLTRWPRTDDVAVGVGWELWAKYTSARLTDGRSSINATVQVRAGASRIYAKAHLPVPLDTSRPYLGVSVSLGGYLVLPRLFGEGI